MKIALFELNILNENTNKSYGIILETSPNKSIAAIQSTKNVITDAIESITELFSDDWFDMLSSELNTTDESIMSIEHQDSYEVTELGSNESNGTVLNISGMTRESDADNEVRKIFVFHLFYVQI